MRIIIFIVCLLFMSCLHEKKPIMYFTNDKGVIIDSFYYEVEKYCNEMEYEDVLIPEILVDDVYIPQHYEKKCHCSNWSYDTIYYKIN